MRYVITCMDNRETSAQLAEEIWGALSADERKLLSLQGGKWDDELMDADVYCICFDYNRNVVPLEVMELLMNLENKTVAFFITSGFAYAEQVRNRLEQELEAFLPESCDYRGMFLCGGRLPDMIVKNAEAVLKNDAENAYAKFVLINHEKTKQHPDAGDITELWDFLQENLDID